MLILEQPAFPLATLCVMSLFAHCVATAVHSVIVPFCLQYLSPPSANIFRSLNLVSLVVLQYTLMRNILPAKENWMEVMGAVLCLFGSVGGTIYELVKQKYSGA